MSSAILTSTGKWFDVLNPDPDLIDLQDIAGALSNLCRYGGHCNRFYSVAEHCILVSRLVRERTGGNPVITLWALLHDASEAYVVDIPRPVKRQIPQYVAIEDNIQQAVAKKFNLPWPMPDEVHQADHDLLAAELRTYMSKQPDHMLPPLTNADLLKILPVEPMSPSRAKQAFLEEVGKFGLS